MQTDIASHYGSNDGALTALLALVGKGVWKFPSLGLRKTRTLLPAHIVQLPTAGGLVIGMCETMCS